MEHIDPRCIVAYKRCCNEDCMKSFDLCTCTHKAAHGFCRDCTTVNREDVTLGFANGRPCLDGLWYKHGHRLREEIVKQVGLNHATAKYIMKKCAKLQKLRSKGKQQEVPSNADLNEQVDAAKYAGQAKLVEKLHGMLEGDYAEITRMTCELWYFDRYLKSEGYKAWDTASSPFHMVSVFLNQAMSRGLMSVPPWPPQEARPGM